MAAWKWVDDFVREIKETGLLEYVGTLTGIASVWFSKKEHILVYPVGLVSTVVYIYICLQGNLLGEASVNVYYTIMSVYGWVLWSKKDPLDNNRLQISSYAKGDAWQPFVFFGACFLVIYLLLNWAKSVFAPGCIPFADAFASATAYTGMWLMAKKKIENWWWWVATNSVSIPLYFIKGYAFTSFQFFIFLVMAVSGWYSWHKKLLEREALGVV